MNVKTQARWSVFALATFAGPPSAVAEIVRAGPADDVASIIGGLSPGDELILADGMYLLDGGAFRFTARGTEGAPIVVRADAGATPHFHRPGDDQNVWDLDVSYFTLRGLEFSGGSAGLRVEAAAHLTIEACHLHDIGDVAIRMNDGGTYESVRILRNHIHHTSHTGEGMYLGCNNDACRFLNGLIEGNYIHHTAVVGTQPDWQGDGIEIKEGGAGNIVRDNVIHDTNYPCILTYSTVGNGPANIIEGNVMWNCGDNGIQSAEDAVIRNNIILSSGVDGIAMQPHQSGIPRNLTVVHNTIIEADGSAISLRGMDGPVTIANNAIYARDGSAVAISGSIAMLSFVGNLGVGSVAGAPASGFKLGDFLTDMVAPHYAGVPPIDVYPTLKGALLGAGDAAYVVDRDFNGTPRSGVADVGAYAHASDGNPGWVIGPNFKQAGPGLGLGGGGAGTGGSGGGGVPNAGGGVLNASGGVANAGGGVGGSAVARSGNETGAVASLTAASDGQPGCGCRTGKSSPAATGWQQLLLAFALLPVRLRAFSVRRVRRVRPRAAVLASVCCLLLGACSEPAAGVSVVPSRSDAGAGGGVASIAGEGGGGAPGTGGGVVAKGGGGAAGSAVTGGGAGGSTQPSGELGWSTVPNTKLQAVCPPTRGDYDFSRCGPVISAWSGGAADIEGDRLIVWGGGHNDYWGNELYAFNLQGLSLERLNDPSPINATPNLCVPELSDNTPNSKHTYGGLAYIAHARRMYVYGGGGACKPGGFSTDTWTLDLETLTWKRMDPTVGGEPAGGLGASDYDPVTKRVYLSNTSELWDYDFDTNQYRLLQANASTDYHMTGVVDPERGMFFLMGGKGTPGGGIFAFRLGAGSTYTMEDWTPDVTGCDDLVTKLYPGLAYDPSRKLIVGWAGGDSVHIFNPDTKSCDPVAYSGGPGAQQENGTHGRWRYLPKRNVFALVNDWMQDAYTFRLPP